MTRRSLRFRLLLAAAVSITLALGAAGVGLTALFERHVTRYLESRLDHGLDQILGNLDIGPDGRIRLVRPPADPRFETPLSGLYWQVQDANGGALLRSRSLWDTELALPGDALPDGALHRHRLKGPAGQSLLAVERRVLFRPDSDARGLRVVVALDRSELDQTRRDFATDILPYLAVLGMGLILAAWFQVRIGLAPLDAVRLGVRSIRSGHSRRLSAGYPDEVMPLVDEVNALLDAQDAAIERSRAWTADLAHGLKTPLVALAADAERLRALDQPALADDLEDLAQTMRRRVDRELIRGRIRAGAAGRPGTAAGRAGARQTSASLGDTLESVLRTLARTPRGATIDWDLECPASVRVAMPPEDLTELLGNLLENASQWARSQVRIRVAGPDESHADQIELRVEDDGPGVPRESLGALGQRGLRLDERTQGSGLGLAIAQDICDAYGSTLRFGTATRGGLAVTLWMPRPPDAATSPGTLPAPGDRALS